MATTSRKRPQTVSLMERVALTRLRRFQRIASIAEQSESPLWQKLARQAAESAYRDCLLAGLSERALERRSQHAA